MNPALKIYDNPEAVKNYRNKKGLYPAEKFILNIIYGKQRKKIMFDIGVGTGRTTWFFSPEFEEYEGSDIAPAMIKACEESFHGFPGTRFYVCNATEVFRGRCNIDFVFFSGQGIGFLETIEETKTFFESVYKALADDGIFAFSFHNAQSLEKRFKFQFPLNPFKIIPAFMQWKKFRARNGSVEQYKGKFFFQLNGDTILARPVYYVEALKKIGFREFQILDNDGRELFFDRENLNNYKQNIIHFICYK